MAIADELALLKSTKASIKESLTNKDLQPTEEFSTYPTLNNWGTGSEENRQSLVKSLVENTVDRTKFSGAKPVTIQLDPAVKALLTSDEIAQITAKGYTIA